MCKVTHQTPVGVRDYLPEEVENREACLSKISSVFENRSYQRIITPSFEYADSLKHALGPGLKDACIQFIGPSGKELMLRPDHTAAIARIVGSRYSQEDLPVRLYYLDSIFRKYETQGEVEFFQVGVEQIGSQGPEADADVIMTCIETLLKLGIKNFGIDIGHTFFLDRYTESQRDALLRGDYISFGEIPKRGGVELVQECDDLVRLYSCLESEYMSQYVHFNMVVDMMAYYQSLD
ncbi:hypothetical protein DID77_00495 [Candidatus Marinamargulisbacteria bacterium SCGC AG-439-L15]|nr:hypothetical protein DID77_00495 [Candidatus Marinamargulisbacteria bacterium SCGC AG-439-L15]